MAHRLGDTGIEHARVSGTTEVSGEVMTILLELLGCCSVFRVCEPMHLRDEKT